MGRVLVTVLGLVLAGVLPVAADMEISDDPPADFEASAPEVEPTRQADAEPSAPEIDDAPPAGFEADDMD